eukprot:scaffold30998_cov66-Phaeocystis_antarctica.AAC.3
MSQSPHPAPRNRSVVPELANLPANFSMNYEMIVDTGTSGNSGDAVDHLMGYFFKLRDQPNAHVSAVLGPTFSSVAKPTALIGKRGASADGVVLCIIGRVVRQRHVPILHPDLPVRRHGRLHTDARLVR